MERGAHRQHDGASGALFAGDFDRAFDGVGVAAHHRLIRRIIVGDDTDPVPRGPGGNLPDGLEIEADDRRHGPLAHRHRFLHGSAASLQEPCGLIETEGAGGSERRILAQRMAGDKGYRPRQIDAALLDQHPDGSQAHRHQCRLRVFGQHQLVLGSLEHQACQILLERLIDLFEHFAGDREGGGERLAHAGRMGALAGKNERAWHGWRGSCRSKSRPVIAARPALSSGLVSTPF